MNFEKTEKPRFVSIILQIKPDIRYTMWKWWGFSDFKNIFTPFPSEDQLFYLIWFHHMICKNKSYLEKVVLWWESASNNEQH